MHVLVQIVQRVLFFTLILYNALNIRSEDATPKIVIDHDGGADDAVAILLALNYEKYFNGPQVVGVTTTHGNVDEPQAFLNTRRILRTAGREDIPIHRGANLSLVKTTASDYFYGLDGLGDNNYNESITDFAPPNQLHAILALIEYSKQYEGRLIVISIGVLTNIALAIRLDPLFLGRLKHLYIGAGTINSDRHPMPEFNARGDVEAYHAVLDSSTPDRVTMMPLSVYRDINITLSWRKEVLGKIPSALINAINDYERVSLNKSSGVWGWGALDPATMALSLENNLPKETYFVKNSIILCGDQRGINTNERVEFEDANVKIIYSIEKESYMNFLLQVFSAGTYIENKY